MKADRVPVYSFVTSLTSLIVVKPDDTTAEAETKRAQEYKNKWHNSGGMFTKQKKKWKVNSSSVSTDIAEDLMFQSSPVMMCAPSYPESMSRRLAFMPKSPAGMNMTTSVSVSPVSPNYDMHQRVPLSVSGMNMFGNASIPQKPPVPINAVDVEHDTPCEVDDDDNDFIEAQTPHQSRGRSPGLFGMPKAKMGIPLSTQGMTLFGSSQQSSPSLFGMSKANTGVTLSAPGVTSFGSSQQSSPGLFGMPQANIGIPLSTPGMTSFGFGSSQQNSGEKDKNTDTNKGTDGSHLQVSGLHVATNIQCDHATVILKFVFNNQIGVANNTEFKIPLPSSAILSYCLMEVDGIEYKGVLDKTEAAQEQFKSAKLENKTAFLMRLSSSNELTITIVEDLHVEAQIQGSYDITSVNIPYLPGSLAGAQGRVVLTTLHPLFANVGTSIAINSRLVGKGAESGLKLERRQPNVIKVVWDPTRSEQEKLHKTAPLLLSFDLDKKSLPGQVLLYAVSSLLRNAGITINLTFKKQFSTEVLLRDSHSLLLSYDRMTFRSRDWTVTIDFLQEAAISYFYSGSNILLPPTLTVVCELIVPRLRSTFLQTVYSRSVGRSCLLSPQDP
uniref:VIT domain-containing protein n=1 Tax=Timema monikensis TaxID=170555 RepID=A0A7R9EAZ2_9NEOP|nr:unnamed protein product [Timema monikensis]